MIDAKISRFDVVGHVSHLGASLPDGRTLSLEAHIDKYRPENLSRSAPMSFYPGTGRKPR